RRVAVSLNAFSGPCCLYLHRFRDLEDARARIARFIDTYNNHWLLERLGYPSPLEGRSDHFSSEVA
ncbi:MAG: hypothetical protein K6U08_06785, partial [Firmicutes bacterium]|nr:hypothetical protein [Bacillota bacterium]